MTRIGYSKLGRSWQIDPNKGSLGNGDVDVRNCITRLGKAHPEVEWVLTGRNSGDVPQSAGMPDNVVNPWTKAREEYSGINQNDRERVGEVHTRCAIPIMTDPTLDTHLVWAGQHGMVNTKIPLVRLKGDGAEIEYASPQISFVNYASYLLHGLNQWRSENLDKEETWLVPDVRNYLKARDLMWPISGPILAQYSRTHNRHMYRYNDPKTPADYGMQHVARVDNKTHPGCWTGEEPYSYSGIELTTLESPDSTRSMFDSKTDHSQRYSFGILVNETRWLGKKVEGKRVSAGLSRVSVLKDWVVNLWPKAEIFGNWSDESKEDLGRLDIRPCPQQYLGPTMQRWRCTVTTPASGSGWATAKPWEAFSYGTVCFKHPKYDDQGWIYGGDMPKELLEWLTPATPEALKKRVDYLDENPATWCWIVNAQRAYFEQKYDEYNGGIIEIERKLGLV